MSKLMSCTYFGLQVFAERVPIPPVDRSAHRPVGILRPGLSPVQARHVRQQNLLR